MNFFRNDGFYSEKAQKVSRELDILLRAWFKKYQTNGASARELGLIAFHCVNDIEAEAMLGFKEPCTPPPLAFEISPASMKEFMEELRKQEEEKE